MKTPDRSKVNHFRAVLWVCQVHTSVSKGSLTSPEQGASAFSLPASAFPSYAKYANNAFVGASQQDYLTVAHELGHLLLNDPYHVENPGGSPVMYDPAAIEYESKNLMFGGFLIGRQIGQGIYDSKRLWKSQVEIIRSNSHVHYL